MAQDIINCDVVIQAGHENTPDSMTGGEGPLGKEIDWTPVVANEAVRILKEAGVDAVKATQFWKNDREDEGTGSPLMGLIQTNSEVFGASVKISVMANIFGSDWRNNEKRLRAMIEIYFAGKKRMVRVPLVDLGPGENAPSHAEVDLTWACDQFLGTRGGATVRYRMLVPS
jgi:hypothetical protein